MYGTPVWARGRIGEKPDGFGNAAPTDAPIALFILASTLTIVGLRRAQRRNVVWKPAFQRHLVDEFTLEGALSVAAKFLRHLSWVSYDSSVLCLDSR